MKKTTEKGVSKRKRGSGGGKGDSNPKSGGVGQWFILGGGKESNCSGRKQKSLGRLAGKKICLGGCRRGEVPSRKKKA